MVMNLEEKKIKTKLVWNQFDLRFILNYNTYFLFYYTTDPYRKNLVILL